MTEEKKRVLVLCTGNSCRSQMAEGWINSDLHETWSVGSAGTAPADCVHPLAVRVMEEVGVDISRNKPEMVSVYLSDQWDLVITVCDSASESCPVFPLSVEVLHISFPDPADAVGSENENLEVFRRVRDDIRCRVLDALRERS
ncbi:MAG: arsenate reductase ArsC [bacterium]|nr:arsenate reductase ArsC [bacterium]